MINITNGVVRVSFGGLKKVRTVEVPGGRRWCAINHCDLVEALKKEVLSRGWRIDNEAYCVTQNGLGMAGVLGIGTSGSGIEEHPYGACLQLGVVNANTRRLAVRLFTGAVNGQHAICNGVVTATRHNASGVLAADIKTALDECQARFSAMRSDIRELDNYRVPPWVVSHCLLETGRQKILGWASVGRMDYVYREGGDGYAWALLQVFVSECRKHVSPIMQMFAYHRFRDILLATKK